LVAVIIAGILDGPVIGANWKGGENGFEWPMLFFLPIALFGLAYKFLFLPVIKFGEKMLFLNAMRDKDSDLKVLFEGFKTQYLNIVLANLIVFALATIGFFLLVIPCFIVLCRLAFVPYLVMDKDMEAMKAIEKSWQMTRGYGWTIFGMGVISVFVFIAGLILCIVGAIFSVMWIHSAFASFYAAVDAQNDDDNPIPILGINEVEE
ncbi:MAG TPA: hypothetical protein VEP89_18090, partial [Draconibacterium sp.]|nr:hypothetical protein [Draconibacterium sp.]